ncbi:ATP-binding cassette subfamily C protein CydD [Thermasporomyces composti]|uniref:ATP-binding cassette subfamily C protein CydD n=2 Tax=Thermasporomyces composti TaxID=696763 RepID=A0A3D9V8I2_THECX|nr:ATP-binding cassette subfamily C protein CydD [Thermasporomyces composti]
MPRRFRASTLRRSASLQRRRFGAPGPSRRRVFHTLYCQMSASFPPNPGPEVEPGRAHAVAHGVERGAPLPRRPSLHPTTPRGQLMPPLDVRLLHRARPVRAYLAAAAGIGLVHAGLVVAQAWLLATLLVDAVRARLELAPVVALVGVLAGRAGVSWASAVVAHRASAALKRQWRQTVLRKVVALGPRWLASEHTGELATLVTKGVDALDGYLSRYLPQLLLAALVPLAVAVTLLRTDPRSALVVVVTVVLVPLAMLLIGRATRRRIDRQWRTLQALSHHFLDVVSGLGTLKAFGRSREQVETIARLADQQRAAGRSTMRVAFLSSLALELLAASSIAVVAIELAHGVLADTLDLRAALAALLLVPEAYHPIRQAAAHYHANVEGMSVADQVFAILDEPTPLAVEHGGRPVPDPRSASIRLDEVTVADPDRSVPLLDRLSLELPAGRVTGIVAPSGAGKSTVLALLIGFARPDAGRVLVGDVDLATVDPERWRERVGWLPQDPVLFAGTVAQNITLDDPTVDPAAVVAAARAAAVDVPLELQVGDRGIGLSAGQRRRIALARALLRDASLLLLDEPTEGVDPETEAALLRALPPLLAGRTVVLVTHRPGLLQLCHHVVRLDQLAVST